MAHEIVLGTQSLRIANRRLKSLLEFALQVAAERAEGAGFAQSLRTWYEQDYFDGCGFDLAERFPAGDAQKFWANCFFDVGRRIFLRRLGNADVSFWQTSAIGDAYFIARMLSRAVQASDVDWHPATEDALEEETFNAGSWTGA